MYLSIFPSVCGERSVGVSSSNDTADQERRRRGLKREGIREGGIREGETREVGFLVSA